MGLFDKLLRRKEPPPASPKKASAEILALVLLRHVLTQFEIPQDDFDWFMKVVEVELRPLCREWIVIYVAWMLIVLARGTYGKQFGEVSCRMPRQPHVAATGQFEHKWGKGGELGENDHKHAIAKATGT
jgi:hypothetical protein